jgi:hypothetical protein
MSHYPLIFRVRQKFEAPRVSDIDREVDDQLQKLSLADTIRAGQTVAITAGSRGIANIGRILSAIVDHLRKLDAVPFIVPAMGSHGGGTVEGQLQVLESLGVTEARCGCPIRASMETRIVCQAPEGFPVHFDHVASEADHVIVCNRVKPHTGFTGDIQSGLMKMMLIGLGKHEGAKVYHRAIHDFDFGQIVRSVANEVFARCNIVAGVAIVENAFDETAAIQAVRPRDFEACENRMLQFATQWMARLPFDRAHVLIVDEIGKNISGTGMDTNVVGRKYNDHSAVDGERPRIKRIVVRDLTEETHGNASGIGLAEFALTRAIDKMDLAKTATNCITASHVTGGMIPLHFRTDREVLTHALSTIGLTPPEKAELMWIRNTLELEELECSAAYWDEAVSRADLEILTDRRPLQFDADGLLLADRGAGLPAGKSHP